ncbi:cytochrome c family protein [Frigidibacter sp. RF13]|uniref:c-type cytochrome n=1 Tax=Frigidibacter sp. RF13 TaxID=2997340 RepID=UPI00226FF92E|nr:cytochrome c family protein [Frigidibacter sp. RF13]MCY1128277.1 cytochrome c family protein [Frigidibacter sp. RF13]
MFDTMTVTKAGGALCGAFLIFLLGKWAAESLYHTGVEGHGGEEVAQAYSIDTGAEGGGEGEAAEAGPDFATVFAAADAAAGEKVFGKCKACHKVDGTNGTGPHLDGVVGRGIGSVADFGFSDALKGLGGNWEPERLNEFLASPKGYAPGTKMAFAGLPKIEDRANLIAYLQGLGG